MHDWVTVNQIAERFGVHRETVIKWRKRENVRFPEPDMLGGPHGANQPMWMWTSVVIWAKDHRPELLVHYVEQFNDTEKAKYRVEVVLWVDGDDTPLNFTSYDIPFRSAAFHTFERAEAAASGGRYRLIGDEE